MRFQAQHFDEQTISSLVIQVLLTGASNKKPVDTNNQRHTYIKKSHNFSLPFITWEEEALHRLTASQPHLYCTASGLLSHRKKLLYSMRPSPSFTDMELFQNGGGTRAFSAQPRSPAMSANIISSSTSCSLSGWLPQQTTKQMRPTRYLLQFIKSWWWDLYSNATTAIQVTFCAVKNLFFWIKQVCAKNDWTSLNLAFFH